MSKSFIYKKGNDGNTIYTARENDITLNETEFSLKDNIDVKDITAVDISGLGLYNLSGDGILINNSGFVGINMSGASPMHHLDVSGNVRITGDLTANQLVGDLSGVNISGDNITASDISSNHIYGTNISGINISGDNITATDISSNYIYGTNISGINISGDTIYASTQFVGDLSGDNISGNHIYGTNTTGGLFTSPLVVAGVPDGVSADSPSSGFDGDRSSFSGEIRFGTGGSSNNRIVAYTTSGGGGYHDYYRMDFYVMNIKAGTFYSAAGDSGRPRAKFGTIDSGVLNSSSDDRIKINETLIINATETLSKLTPQIYDKYTNMDLSGATNVESGLIAQEVYYNAPELRHLVQVASDRSRNNITPDEMDLSSVDIRNDPDYGSHGWSNTEPSSLNYIGLIPYLIKSNQELHERIKQLESK